MRYTKKYHRPQLGLNPDIQAMLTNYHWPGNVRELINVVERSVILAKGDRLELNLTPESAANSADRFADLPTMDELQRRYLKHVLKKIEGRIAGSGGTADILGLKPSTLYHRMNKLGIKR
ncbi:MAG: hypothetical protein GY866_30680 [Proteobacteria bacterium]|nr:hypothetical protein [Pseudomonadota bacterium]